MTKDFGRFEFTHTKDCKQRAGAGRRRDWPKSRKCGVKKKLIASALKTRPDWDFSYWRWVKQQGAFQYIFGRLRLQTYGEKCVPDESK